MRPILLDERDRRILGALATNARATFKDLGMEADLSANATAERVQRLVDLGVIQRFTVDVSSAALGRALQADIDVRLQPGTTMAQFEQSIQRLDSVLDACVLTGTFDARLRVAISDPDGLNRVVETLRASCGVQETCSALVCRRLDLRAHGTSGVRLPLR